VISRIFSAGLLTLVIKVAGAVLSYAMVVALAHLLRADDYGRFAFGLNTAIILAAIGNLGFSTGIMRYWPKYLVEGDKAAAKGVVIQGFELAFMCGAGLAVAAWLAALIVRQLGWNVDPVIFAVIGALGLLINLGDMATNLLRAQGSVVVSMLPRDVLWRIMIPLCAFAAFHLGLGLSGTSALAISAGILLVLTLWQMLYIRRYVLALGVQLQAQKRFARLRPSLIPLWFSGIIYAMIQQFDVVIVGSLLGKAEAGSYFAAQKTAMLLSLVLIAGGLVTAPQMAALFQARKFDQLQSLCRRLAMIIALVTAAGFVFLVFFGQQLLGLFDPAFQSAYSILLIIGLGTMIDAVSGPNAYLMQMTDYEKPYLKIMAACYAAVVAAQFILIPRMGSLGAALASAGGVIAWNVSAIVVLRRKAGLDPSLLSLICPPRTKQLS
jgi:O-antigen/teichoic acid export membrane protein